MMRVSAIALLLALPAGASAEPHAHGVARADVALDGSTVQIEMRIPAADVLGFEHAARTDAQKDRVARARDMFEAPQKVVALSDGAECALTVVSIEIGPDVAEEDHDIEENDEAHGHDDHAHDEHDEHAHDEAAHDDHTKEDAKTHSEVRVVYSADCARPGALESIAFPYFEQEVSTSTLEVRAISVTGALAGDLSADKPALSLSGLSGS
jgi:hypothetical protein